MLEFKKVDFSDIEILRAYFEKDVSRMCDRTIAGTVMWRDYCETAYTVFKGTVIFYVKYINGKRAFSFFDYEYKDFIFDEIEKYALSNNRELNFCTVSEEEISFFKSRYSDAQISTDLAWSDYLYEAEKLSLLSGKKYNGQRNHINKFKKNYGNYSFEPLSENNVKEVLEFYDSFKVQSENTSSMALEEGIKTREVILNNSKYNLLTGVLRIDGKVQAFTAGEKNFDTLFVHIEKANTAFLGIYPMLTNLFLKEYSSDCLFVNREEDDGEEGLRYSKTSYHPINKISKYFVSVK